MAAESTSPAQRPLSRTPAFTNNDRSGRKSDAGPRRTHRRSPHLLEYFVERSRRPSIDGGYHTDSGLAFYLEPVPAIHWSSSFVGVKRQESVFHWKIGLSTCC